MGPALFNIFINDLERAVEQKITRCAGDTKEGQLWIYIHKIRAGIQRDLAWRNGLTGMLWNSTRTNAKCCNPESKQYRLQWFGLVTDWLAGKKQVCQKGHGGQQTEQEPPVCTGKAANSILGYISSSMAWHGLREMIILLTWHSLDCRVQFWVPNIGKTSINWSKVSEGPPGWFVLKHTPS